MELKEQRRICNSLENIPNDREIQSLARGIEWRIVFAEVVKAKREKIGEVWQLKYPKYQIGIHSVRPEITITKLITDKEIEEHQDFFEKCAKDYRQLAIQLINEFADKNNIKIDSVCPMNTLYHTNEFGYKPVGRMNDWRYAFHGIHCGLTNIKTGQSIEVPLTYGLEFGELDPWFFTKYIKTTNEYKPLPVGIYCDYADGKRILEKMVELGKFEYINSNFPDEQGIVVTDREKVEVLTYSSRKELQKELEHNVHNSSGFWSKLKRWIF